jgi:cytochrome c-type biogenesis protein CcmH
MTPRFSLGTRKRISAKALLKAIVFAFGVVLALPALETNEAIGQLAGDMEGSHPIGIENETQRQLFYSLICMCGCPRETLGTCPCNFAHTRRLELKAALADGKSVETIQDEYVARYGPQALAVPRDKGAARLVWAAPLVAIVGGAFGLVFVLKRWRRRAEEDAAAEALAAKKAKKSKSPEEARDDYDDKLDQELRELDRE